MHTFMKKPSVTHVPAPDAGAQARARQKESAPPQKPAQAASAPFDPGTPAHAESGGSAPASGEYARSGSSSKAGGSRGGGKHAK